MKTLLVVSIIVGIGITLAISGVFYYHGIYTKNCEAEGGFMDYRTAKALPGR